MGINFFAEVMPEEFGDFFKAMFTMWQIMTMDSWASGIARVIIFEHNMWSAALFPGLPPSSFRRGYYYQLNVLG